MSPQSLPLGHLSFCHSFTIVDTGLIQLPNHCLDAAAKGRAALNELVHTVSAAVFAQVCTIGSITLRTLSPALLHHLPGMTGASTGVCKPNPRDYKARLGPFEGVGSVPRDIGRVRSPFPGNKSELEPNPFPLQITHGA